MLFQIVRVISEPMTISIITVNPYFANVLEVKDGTVTNYNKKGDHNIVQINKK